MTPDRLRQMADAATPGPWRVAFRKMEVLSADGGMAPVAETQRRMTYEEDARLIAALDPRAARLLADAMETMHHVRDKDWPYLGDEKSPAALLASFDALEEDT